MPEHRRSLVRLARSARSSTRLWRSGSPAGRPRAPRCRARRTQRGSRRRPRDPVELLEEQAQTRVPELVPIRYGRMLVSPFTFYRGAADLMAADLAGAPRTGLQVQLCGDAHLSNFGAFASPERRLVFSINDFDETLPGPVRVGREAAGRQLRGRRPRSRLRRQAARARSTCAVGRAYREAMRDVRRDAATSRSGTPASTSTRSRRAGSAAPAPKQRKRFEQNVAKARAKDSMQAFAKLTRRSSTASRASSAIRR